MKATNIQTYMRSLFRLRFFRDPTQKEIRNFNEIFEEEQKNKQNEDLKKQEQLKDEYEKDINVEILSLSNDKIKKVQNVTLLQFKGYEDGESDVRCTALKNVVNEINNNKKYAQNGIKLEYEFNENYGDIKGSYSYYCTCQANWKK